MTKDIKVTELDRKDLEQIALFYQKSCEMYIQMVEILQKTERTIREIALAYDPVLNDLYPDLFTPKKGETNEYSE